MEKLLITTALILATASPALANKTATSEAHIDDHYKIVLEQTPYKVEVCRDVQVPVNSKNEFDKEDAIIGAIIGGVIGNQFGKGSGKQAMTGVGAATGAIIAGSKEGKKEYRWERQCNVETRYKETESEIYSHSTVRFWHEGQRIELEFHK